MRHVSCIRPSLWGLPVSISADSQICSVCFEAPVPADLETAGLCLEHYTLTVERICMVMHRQIASQKVNAEYCEQLASYVVESALLLSRVASNLYLSNELKTRVLTTFISLMNLLEDLDRPKSFHSFHFGNRLPQQPQARA
jgi:hypothetical protein